MNEEVLRVVELFSNEKGVSKEVIFDALELALAAATRKGQGEEVDIKVSIDQETGDYETFRCWTITRDEDYENPEAHITIEDRRETHPDAEVGDVVRESVPSIRFGRILLQTVKQVLVQRIREAERALVIEAYESRVGELLSGQVKKVTREALIVDLGNNAEALLPRESWIPRETFRVGERLRAILAEIRPDARDAPLIMSRTTPAMLAALFRIEVPEVQDGVIEILAAARDPGSRAKIAVKTNDGRIDPVGACVGMRGNRVQAVSGELAGERVDIVLWDDNVAQFAINAMSPAEVMSIVLDDDSRSMDIAVTEDNLAQAIGRNGQNVRLASDLTGWMLNIMTEEEASVKRKEETESASQLFMDSLGVDETLVEVLIAEGFSTLEEVAYVPVEEFLRIDGFEQDLIEELRSRARDALLTRALAEEQKLEPTEDLLQMEGMDSLLARRLAGHGIISMQDLADQSVADLLEIEDMDEERAGALIMTARAPLFEESREEG